MLISSLCITFTSCSDDDDDDKTTPDYAKEIAATYKGDIFMVGDNPVATDAIIKVTRIAENKVKLEMNQDILTLPINIECESDVKFANDKYSIEGKTTVSLPVEGVGTVDAGVELDGNFDKEGNSEINITVKQSEESTIKVVYKGKKQ